MSVVVDMAEAVVNELNATSFSQTFTARRSYLPRSDLAEMKDLHVTVVPKGLGTELHDRRQLRKDVQVDVAVQKKLDKCDNAEIDALEGLVEEIAEHFQAKRQVGQAVWLKTDHPAIYAPEHLEQLRQFTSVITLTFRVVG